MGSNHKWIVVTQGIQPGVYRRWIRAAPYIVPVFGRAIFQGFDDEEEAWNEWNEQVRLGNIKILEPRNRSPSPDDLVEEFLSDSDPESSPPPRTPTRLTTRQRARQPPSQEVSQASLETPVQTPGNRTRRTAVGYPQDGNNAYFTRPPGSTVLRPENLSSNTSQPDTTSPRASASSADSFETAATSLYDAEVESSAISTRPVTPEQNTQQSSPLGLPFGQLSIDNIRRAYPSTPRTASEASQASRRPTEPKPPKLTKNQLRNVTTTRGSGSPSRRQSPRNLVDSDSASYPVAGPSSRNARTPTRPLRREACMRVITDSGSSAGSSSPSPRSRSKLPSSAV